MADGSTPKNDEARLAEIREQIHDALAANDRPGEPCNRWLDADVVLDQLARVRTDTIAELLADLRRERDRWGTDQGLYGAFNRVIRWISEEPLRDPAERAAVRGVSHEH